jgi:hypothetical protein
LAVDEDVARLDQRLHGRSTEIVQMVGHEPVEPQSELFSAGKEHDRVILLG